LLGTDNLGRDVLSRLLYGARISLFAGFVATVLAMSIGVGIGAVAGFLGDGVETTFMRLTDSMMAFPPLLLAVALATALRPGVGTVIIVISFAFWMPMARVVRGQVLSLRERQYVEAARSMGFSRLKTLWSHVLPHTVPLIIVYGTLAIGNVILFEAALDFLGAGIQPPTPTWGAMIAEGQPYFLTASWLLIVPGIAIVLTVGGFNLLGDGLRDVLQIDRDR
jgi:peptide/nickel transport system permease protein